MAERSGSGLNVRRVSRDLAEFDYHHEKDRVRGVLHLRLLTSVINALKHGTVSESSLHAFLENGRTDLNLAPGAAPMTLETFLLNHYLPEKKKPEVKPTTYQSAADEVRRLIKTLGKVPLHEIGPRHAEEHKSVRLALKTANVTIRADLITLGEALDYAVARGLVRERRLRAVKGLPPTDRTPAWLRLGDIPRLMRCLPRRVKPLAYFLLLAGPRLSEALAMTTGNIDWDRREILIPNSKRRRRSTIKGKRMRTLKIDVLGPRFEWLLRRIIKPDPVTGHLFPGRFPGKPMSRACAEDLFHRGVMKAGLEHLIPPEIAESGGHPHLIIHDLRRSFFEHAALSGMPFQQLRAYTGQTHVASVQAYLDEASDHDPRTSIFRHLPLRVRRAKRPEPPVQQASEEPLHDSVPRPTEFPQQPFLH